MLQLDHGFPEPRQLKLKEKINYDKKIIFSKKIFSKSYLALISQRLVVLKGKKRIRLREFTRDIVVLVFLSIHGQRPGKSSFIFK